MRDSQKEVLLNEHLFYELRMLLGAARLVKLFDANDMGNTSSIVRDSIYLHARNLYNFFHGCAKNDASVHDFIKKSFDVSLYLEYKHELHEAVLHIKRQRVGNKKLRSANNRLPLDKIVVRFAEDIESLWITWIENEEDLKIKENLIKLLKKAKDEADDDYVNSKVKLKNNI